MTVARARSLFLWGLVGSLSATAALAIGTLLLGDFEDTEARILVTTALLSLGSLLALPAGVLLDRGRLPWLARGGTAAIALAFALAMIVLWANLETEWIWKLDVTLWLGAGWGAQAAATSIQRGRGDGPWVTLLYGAAMLLGAALVVLVAVAVWAALDDATGYYRALGAVAVAAVLTSLLQPIVRRAQQAPEARARLVLELDREPTDAAVAAAVEALERHGVRVGEVVGRQV